MENDKRQIQILHICAVACTHTHTTQNKTQFTSIWAPKYMRINSKTTTTCCTLDVYKDLNTKLKHIFIFIRHNSFNWFEDLYVLSESNKSNNGIRYTIQYSIKIITIIIINNLREASNWMDALLRKQLNG